ncbi:MAG: DinB family protein [Actinomycetota bacterium]|nr:DinB family protein [Actinomycetota bacterium]
MGIQESSGWQRFFGNAAQTCAECGYAWAVTLDDADTAVMSMPRAVAALTGHPRARRKPAPAVWSPAAYAWHTADAIRIWAERFAAIAAQPDAMVEPFDQNRLADARGYESMPAAGAAWAVERAVVDWAESVQRVDPPTRFAHRDYGAMSVADAVRYIGHEAHHHAWDIANGLGG